MVGHFSNELNILGQFLWAATNTSFRPDGTRIHGPKGDASATQFILFMKLLAGRLHEVNNILSSRYYGKGLDKRYTHQLDPKGRDAGLYLRLPATTPTWPTTSPSSFAWTRIW